MTRVMIETNETDYRIVEAFNTAIADIENHYDYGGMNWDYVESDMIMNENLSMFTVGEIVDSLYLLADMYDNRVEEVIQGSNNPAVKAFYGK